MKTTIFHAELIDKNGKTKRHNGRPSKKFLKNNKQFVAYEETGLFNEFYYTTKFKIEDARLIEISDNEIHERSINLY